MVQSGYIYCFTTHENPNIIKCGRTDQKVEKRLGGYLGPTKPRHIIFIYKVDDSVEAEKMMLKLFYQNISLKQRKDLGLEWFQTTGEFTFQERERQLVDIAEIVKKASRTCTNETMCNEQVVKKPKKNSENGTQLRGMDFYFENFDNFVKEAAQPTDDPAVLLHAFETSKYSPYGNFCQFFPYPEEVRVDVVKNRYDEFLRPEKKCKIHPPEF